MVEPGREVLPGRCADRHAGLGRPRWGGAAAVLAAVRA